MASVSVPGLHAPAAGFDQPFELLAACHDRVRQRLDLLARLIDHLAAHGPDAAAQSAAADVLRYFDVAAPLHHDDEERHLVPRLLASPDPAHHAAARQLLDGHVQIRQAWRQLSPLLTQLAAPEHAARQDAATRFIALHAPHLQLEDELVYPAISQQLSAEEATTMGQEMAARRGVLPPPPTSRGP